MLNQIKAVIFDLDGTLVDSMGLWRDIDIAFLGERGIAYEDSLQEKIEGMSFTETAMYFKEKFCLPLTAEQIKRVWIEMSIDKYRSQVPAKRGAKEFLSYARDRGMLCGIATSNSWEMVDAVLDSLGMRPFFQAVTTACQVKAGKPSPDIYLTVAEDLHVSPGQCLVFEDVPAGILAGKRAGMTVCAVEDEFSRHMEEEKRELADYFISDYFEIMDGCRL